MPNSYTCLHYHFIFSTKDRRLQLDDDIRARLFQYVGGIFRDLKGCLLAANSLPDHVHLLAGLHPSTAVSDVMREVKSGSSKWIHETYPGRRDFGWQDGFGAFTVSYSQLDEVTRYIANQQQHHQRRTFQEEFIEFLERHGVPYDERYIWL